MEFFEIVIIGAGPGGLNCARILGNAGKKVLLLEKNQEIGPKVCAGGLTRKSFQYLGLSKKIISRNFRKITFNAPKIKTEINFKEDYFYSIDRKKLGQWQAGKINRNYVTIKKQAKVTKIEKNYLEINDCEKISYKYLVGADGSNSLVRKYLGLKTKLLGVAIQYLVPTRKFNDFEIFFNSKSFHSWYLWIIPHDNYVSIGCGYFGKLMTGKKITDNFNKWLKKNNVNISNAEYQAFPINCDYQGFKFKNVFLIGDAAGLASGFTGEGIYQALASGEDVAKTILNKKHKAKKINEILRERLYQHLMLLIVIFSGPFRNFIFNFVTFCMKNKLLSKTLVRILT